MFSLVFKLKELSANFAHIKSLTEVTSPKQGGEQLTGNVTQQDEMYSIGKGNIAEAM